MKKKAGFVSIIGKPNAGKSTLLNSILESDISIITPKPQTTRNRIYGIYTKDNVQIIFIDTPGILKPKYKLQEFMKREIENSFFETDLILLIIDITKYSPEELTEISKEYSKSFDRYKTICVLNKIDLVKSEIVLHTIKDISEKNNFSDIVPLSAKKDFNISELLNTILSYLPEHDFYFDAEVITSHPERFFVSEIIRKQIINLYREELPFSAFVEINEFKERSKSKDYIKAEIIIERESQKKIIIGEQGRMIKKLGEHSRKEIEDFLGREIYLELFVKVIKNWKNDEHFIKRKFLSQKTGTTEI